MELQKAVVVFVAEAGKTVVFVSRKIKTRLHIFSLISKNGIKMFKIGMKFAKNSNIIIFGFYKSVNDKYTKEGNMTKQKTNMCEGPILKQIITFVIPILLLGFVQQLFNAADVVLAGRLSVSGSDAVAAVGATNSLRSLLVSFFMGCSTIAFSKQLLGLYIEDSNEAIAWGAVRIIFIFGRLFIQGFMDTTSGALRGLGVSISNTVISLAGICGVRILWCMTVFQIPKFHTPEALFIIYPISWVIISILQYVVYDVVYKKQKNSVQAEM